MIIVVWLDCALLFILELFIHTLRGITSIVAESEIDDPTEILKFSTYFTMV